MIKSSHSSASGASLRRHERGSATLKFLAVVVTLFLVGHAGFNYIMVWYQCTHFKDKMTEIITQAYALPNANLSAPDTIRQKLRSIGNEDGVPANALINVQKQTNGTQAQVAFTREVAVLPMNMYNYKYQFNYTAAPPSMWTIK